MKLHRVIAVYKLEELGAYEVECEITDWYDERYTTMYVSREEDMFGLAREVRAAMKMFEEEPQEARLIVATPDWIKSEAFRRIRKIMPSWMVERQMSGGESIPQEVQLKVQAIRETSAVLENMKPIPLDYTEDKYWP